MDMRAFRTSLAALTLGMSLAASGAQATILVTGQATSDYRLQYEGQPTAGSAGDATGASTLYDRDGAVAGAVYYQSSVYIQPTAVTFFSGDAATGRFSEVTSTSSVAISVTNTDSASYAFSLQSTITPAGLGMYLADRTNCGGALATDCPETSLVTNFGAIPPPKAGGLLAESGFTFTVKEGNTVLYKLDGSLLMNFQGGSVVLADNMDAARAALNGFTLATPASDGLALADMKALGYAWDATDFTLGDLGTIGAGATRTLTYSTTVWTRSQAFCNDPSQTACLTAYSGFGDPIGRGGGVEEFESLTAFAARTFGASALTAPTGGIDEVNFQPIAFQYPTFDRGVLSFRILSGVPEPRTWAMMLLGFGLIGAAARRQRGDGVRAVTRA